MEWQYNFACAVELGSPFVSIPKINKSWICRSKLKHKHVIYSTIVWILQNIKILSRILKFLFSSSSLSLQFVNFYLDTSLPRWTYQIDSSRPNYFSQTQWAWYLITNKFWMNLNIWYLPFFVWNKTLKYSKIQYVLDAVG